MMNTWDRERQYNKHKQKLQGIKSTLPRLANGPNSSTGVKKKGNCTNTNFYNSNMNHNQSSTKPLSNTQTLRKTKRTNSNYQKQSYLKHLLREFGLGQYLRKMFDVGYDDNTIHKLGLLSFKAFEELLITLRIFPGHQVKMSSLYEYLRQMNIYSTANKPKTSSGIGRRYHSFNSANTHKQERTAYSKSNSNSADPFDNSNYKHNNCNNNNNIVGSFLQGDFGLNYYLENANNNNLKPIEIAKLDKSDSSPMDNQQHQHQDHVLKDDEQSEKMDEEIDRMLRYYMEKLNEKLDASFDSIDDSSISTVNNKEILPINDQKNIDNISDIKINRDKENGTFANSLITKKENENSKSNNNSNQKLEIIGGKEKSGTENNLKHEKGKGGGEQKSAHTANNSNSNQLTNNNSQGKNESNKDSHLTNTNANIASVNKNKGKSEKEKETQLNIKDSSNRPSSNTKMNQEETRVLKEVEVVEQEEIKEEYKNNEHVVTEDIIVEDLNAKEKDGELKHNDKETYREEEAKVSNEVCVETKAEAVQAQFDDYDSDPMRRMAFNKEEAMFENIRLTKSFEAESLRQNTEQFDIEYMCRCLGLAIMKHLESSKDKQHITDLIEIKEMFSFYSSLYNSKIDFVFNFFNKSLGIQPLSNLDRLDLEEAKSKEECLPKIQKDISEYKEEAKPISFVTHVKHNTPELPEIKPKKLKSGLGDIEKDIKFIDEFFSVNKKRNYQNLSDKAKNALLKDLSYINEVDSHEKSSSKMSSSHINKSHITNNNNDNSVLKQSMYEIEPNKTLLPELGLANAQLKKNNSMINSNKNSMQDESSSSLNNNPDRNLKFSNLANEIENDIDDSYKQTPITKIQEDIQDQTNTGGNNKEVFESGEMESNYLIDASTVDKLRIYLLKQAEIYDDDYVYQAQRIQTRKYVPLPDPQSIFEFCANIMILTKMEKEVIIIALIYIERLIFNTGLLLTSRNWRRISFTAMIMASKIWDDDSFENNHFAQVFTHLSIGEINFLERVYLELINYKVYVKCSEYFKYFFVIKSIALKYNYNGMNLVPISVEKMMKIQEYAYQMQKKIKKKYSLSNSAQF